MTTVAAAWQAALASEHAAVAGYDVLGPRLADAAQVSLARDSQQAHRALRDATSARLIAAGQSPVAAASDYPLPFAVSDPVTAQRFAISLESACAAAWRYLISVVAASSRSARADAQQALTDSAVRAMRWRRLVAPTKATVAFPGID
jgi:Domain of unknown function (DUF4439)